MEKLVKKYFDAWLRKDVDGVLALLSDSATYHDVFWNETCLRSDFRAYIVSEFQNSTYRYVGFDCHNISPNCTIIRYTVYAKNTRDDSNPLFEGADVITVKDDRIQSVRDCYFDPNLKTVIGMASQVHDAQQRPKYSRSGLRGPQAADYKIRLLDLMENEQAFTDSNLTLVELAERLQCSVNHLSQVINTEFRPNFNQFLNEYRIELAQNLQATETDDPNLIINVAHQSGFGSVSSFYNSFKKACGQTPKQFSKQHLATASTESY